MNDFLYHIFMSVYNNEFSASQRCARAHLMLTSFTMAIPFEIRRQSYQLQTTPLVTGHKVDCGPFFEWWYIEDYGMVTFMANSGTA